MKSTQKDIQVAEGLPHGKTHTGNSTAMNPSFGGTDSTKNGPSKAVKSHEADVKRGEGLAMGKTIGGKSHERVLDSGKFDKATQKRGMQLNERSEAGNADPCGGWDCE